MPRTWRIYRIERTVSGKCYFGLTCEPIRERWWKHVHSALKANSPYAIHAAIRKYGASAYLAVAEARIAELGG